MANMPTRYRARNAGHGELLRKMRSKYPFRLVIDKDKSPKPPSIDKAIFGDFAYMPMTDGNEWLFLTRAARALFISTYGGTILGE